MNTLYFLMLALALTGQNKLSYEPATTPALISPSSPIEATAPELNCPDDITVVIEDMSCTKDVMITAPELPGEFTFGFYEVYYDYQGISPGIASSSPPEPDLRILSDGGIDTTVTFYGGTNVISYLAVDADDTEYDCSYTITVLDGVAPEWPDDEPTSFEGICGLTDAIEVWENNEYSPIDNCCNTKNLPAEIHSIDTICGNEIRVTLFVLGGDGSGDPIYGGPSEFPCITSFGNAEDFFADTLWITVDLIDTVPAEISGIPANDTISCSSSPNIPTPTALDVCGGDLTDQIQLDIMESDDVCGSNGDINRVTTYTWTVDDGCGNIASASWKVFYLNENDFEVNVTGGGLECNELSRELDAGPGGETYSWSTGETTQTIQVTVNGVYTVTVTSPDGCCAIDSAQVTFGDEQVLQATGGTITCLKPEIQLDAGIETDTYEWTGPNGFMSSEASPVVTDTGEYIIVASSNLGCSASDTVRVEIDTSAPDVEASFGGVDCDKLSVQLLGSSATENATYLWTGPNGFQAATSDTTAELAGTYELTVTAPNGCTASTSLVLGAAISRPQLAIATRPAIDGNNGIAWVNITGGQEPYDIEWSTSATSDTITGLTVGTRYSVTVTDQNNCVASRDFFVNPAATVCDLTNTPIGTNSRIDDTLSGAAPYVMYREVCVNDAFGNPDEGSLFAKSFLFERTSDQNELELKLRSDGNLQAFIFQCELQPEYSSQLCIEAVSDSASLQLDPGFYYIAVMGETESPYQLIIEESEVDVTLCKAPSTDLTCGTLINDQVGANDIFNVNNGAYEACYRGSRSYDGPEKVYILQVERNSVVEFSFTSQSSMGVFLYNFQCTGQCISAFESVGSAQVKDAIVLNSGFYYVVVDQAIDEPGKNFTLQVNCTELMDSPWPDRREVECYNDTAFHKIRLIPNMIDVDEELLDPTGFVALYFLDPSGRRKIGPGYPLFLTDFIEEELQAFADDLNLTDVCGYLEGEPINYRLRTGRGVVLEGQVGYEDSDSVSFRIGGDNRVSTFIQREGSQVSITRVDPAEIKDRPFDATVTELSVQANQTWIVSPDVVDNVPWIQNISVKGTSGGLLGNGNGTIVVEHSQNPGIEPRTAEIVVTFDRYGEVLRHSLTQGGDSTSSVTLVQDIGEFSIRPNPASRAIFIQASLNTIGDAHLSIYNLLGQQVFRENAGNTKTINKEISVLDWPPGMYLATLTINGRQLTNKLIVAHE